MGCFRPAPPVEEGDGRETGVVTITEPDGTVVVQAHPLVKKRALAASTPVASVVQTPSASGAGGSSTTTTVAGVPTGWQPEAYIKAANAEIWDNFGYSVAISGDTVAVGTPEEWSKQRTISNGASASPDNSGQGYGAVYVYRNASRVFDPAVWVESAAIDSITFRWHANLGNTSQVKVAPASLGKASAAQNCDGGTILSPGTTSYTYSGLSAGSRYGFRFCGWDGSIANGGMPLWAETSAQDFSQGTDGWSLINNQNGILDRNKTYMNGSADKMLGPIGKLESISKTFALDGTPAVISFDLLVLESWDGEKFKIFGTNAAWQQVLILSEAFQHATA
ncbi:hypothetical protein EBR21_13745, partial [bacterium]|nr:hypothetical protein [bacterium]